MADCDSMHLFIYVFIIVTMLTADSFEKIMRENCTRIKAVFNMNKMVTEDKYRNKVLFNPPTPPLPYLSTTFHIPGCHQRGLQSWVPWQECMWKWL